jgi:3-oxoacyl-[acyl-carrier protein] reductase
LRSRRARLEPRFDVPAVAERLAADGAAVAINYSRDAASAHEVVNAIEAEGGRAVAVQADVSKPTEITRLFGHLAVPARTHAGSQDSSSAAAASSEPASADQITALRVE